MKITTPTAAVFVLLLVSSTVVAKPTTFLNHGLKYITLVTLEVTGKTATGTFVSYADERRPGTPFTGKVIPTPKGKKGVYLEVHFDGEPPYNIPPGAKRLIWYLKIVDRRAHLFIPMHEREYTGRTPKWVVSDVELEPEDEDEPSG
jgi:hypothetical protein